MTNTKLLPGVFLPPLVLDISGLQYLDDKSKTAARSLSATTCSGHLWFAIFRWQIQNYCQMSFCHHLFWTALVSCVPTDLTHMELHLEVLLLGVFPQSFGQSGHGAIHSQHQQHHQQQHSRDQDEVGSLKHKAGSKDFPHHQVTSVQASSTRCPEDLDTKRQWERMLVLLLCMHACVCMAALSKWFCKWSGVYIKTHKNVHKNAVYHDETQHTNFGGNPFYEATKRPLNNS